MVTWDCKIILPTCLFAVEGGYKVSKQKEYKVGIYIRLSNEDARAGESVSVENQKLLLTKHVREQGWELCEIYCDDGFSGTNQNRPSLQRMLADVKTGFINTVLIKDLSRLGRNYLEVGNLAEVFLPQYGCELISLTEKVDDMMVFRNWFNEQHSKETSKKVKTVKRMCAENGKFLGTYAPYGYRKDPSNKHRLIVDEVAAPTVQRIFKLRAEGKGFRAIASTMNESGVIPPRDYYYEEKKRANPLPVNHLWNENTIKVILRNEAYIGNIVQAKVGTVSYKSRKIVKKPKEEWIRAEGKHEALIEKSLWDRVQEIDRKKYKPRATLDGTSSIFTGILYCADCGNKMRNQNERRKRQDGSEHHRSYFICGNYARSGKGACTVHTISEDALYQMVVHNIRRHARLVECDEKRIIEAIRTLRGRESDSSRTAYMSEIKIHRDRLVMLDRLIEKLYEDRLTGTIPESIFHSLIQKYEQERVDRKQTVQRLEERIASIRQDEDGTLHWAEQIKQYTHLEVLDAEILLRLIDRIVVGEAQIIDGNRVCDVQIHYNYVGNLDWLGIVAHEGAEAAYGQAV